MKKRIIKKKKEVSANEIATLQNSQSYYSMFQSMPNPDKVLKSRGNDVSIYSELLYDDQVRACVRSRKAGVFGLEHSINFNDCPLNVKKFTTNLIKNIDIHKIINQTLDTPLLGFTVFELVYREKQKGQIEIDLVNKPSEWFNFDGNAQLQFKSKKKPMGELISNQNKFIVASNESNILNPYGFAELSNVFWYVTLKKGGLKFWVRFVEKFGMPFIVGKTSRGISEAEQLDLLQKLDNMVEDSVAVIPDDSSIDMQEGNKNSSNNTYESFLDFCNNSISKAILGSTLTVENTGSTGSQALGNVHQDSKTELIESDKRFVEFVINEFIKRNIQLFIGELDTYPTFNLISKKGLMKELAERDKLISEYSNYDFTKDYLIKTYGFDDSDLKEREESSPFDFAESETKDTFKLETDKLLNQLYSKLENFGDSDVKDYMEHEETITEYFNKLLFIKRMEGYIKEESQS